MLGLGVEREGKTSKTPDVRLGKGTDLAIKEGGWVSEGDIYYPLASEEHYALPLIEPGPSP